MRRNLASCASQLVSQHHLASGTSWLATCHFSCVMLLRYAVTTSEQRPKRTFALISSPDVVIPAFDLPHILTLISSLLPSGRAPGVTFIAVLHPVPLVSPRDVQPPSHKLSNITSSSRCPHLRLLTPQAPDVSCLFAYPRKGTGCHPDCPSPRSPSCPTNCY